jgi:hypothetical protein
MSGSNSTIVCPKCKANVNLRGRSMTIALTCPSCQTYYCIADWNQNTYQFNLKVSQEIPLGAKGRFDNFLYEVIGFVVKEESRWHYKWKEYLLFNPYRGYAFLSEHNGHWNFIWPLEDEPEKSAGTKLFYENQKYDLYQKYRASVVYAKGEFFFDVVGITSSTTNEDYISPPYLITVERSEDSIIWCKGEYFSQKEISSIFSIPSDKLPGKEGIGYTQPFNTDFSRSALIWATVAALVLIVALQVLMSYSSEEKVVYHGAFHQSDLKEDKMIVTSTFELSEGLSSLEFYIEAPLDNDWFYGEFSLINEGDGTEYNFSKDIEFYYGREDGENWSEGAKVGSAYISKIPGGKYHVNIYPEFSMLNNTFSVIITRDVPTTSNFWFTGLAIVLFPVLYLIRHHHRERKRWSDSEYSPYDSE